MSKSYVLVASSTNMPREMDARLHTATSPGAVYSMISVHRLEDLMVPRCWWLLLALHAS